MITTQKLIYVFGLSSVTINYTNRYMFLIKLNRSLSKTSFEKLKIMKVFSTRLKKSQHIKFLLKLLRFLVN